MMVTFPIAFLVGTLGSDIAFLLTNDDFWARASVWLLILGIMMGLIAALGGLIDFIALKSARNNAGWRANWSFATGSVS